MMWRVIVRSTWHRDDEPCGPVRGQSTWVRAQGKDRDTADRSAAQSVADGINAWDVVKVPGLCIHHEAVVVPSDAGEFGAARGDLRSRLESAGVIVDNPGPPGRIRR